MRCFAPFALLTVAISLTATARGQDLPARPDPGNAAAEAAAVISVEGTCPDASAVDRAIEGLIPRGLAALPESARVTVEDQGESYRVDAVSEKGARARMFRDPLRDCEQRARFAGVFVVLTLLPPELALNPPPPPPAPPPPAPPPPRPAPPRPPRRLGLEMAILAEAAPAVAASTSMLALGGELRFTYRLGPVSAMLGAAFEPRIDFSFSGLEGREMRVPLDAGLRVQRPVRGLELGVEASVAVAPFHADGLQTAMPAGGTRLDVGGRVGAMVRLARPQARLAPFLGIHAVVFPWPYELGVVPTGGLGTTPVLWLGATAGLSGSL